MSCTVPHEKKLLKHAFERVHTCTHSYILRMVAGLVPVEKQKSLLRHHQALVILYKTLHRKHSVYLQLWLTQVVAAVEDIHSKPQLPCHGKRDQHYHSNRHSHVVLQEVRIYLRCMHACNVTSLCHLLHTHISGTAKSRFLSKTSSQPRPHTPTVHTIATTRRLCREHGWSSCNQKFFIYNKMLNAVTFGCEQSNQHIIVSE